MYTILANDGRSYGPVTLEQLRQWMAEGRVNAQTLGWIEGTTNWKPLGAFPELASLFPPPPPPAPPRIAAPAGKSKLAAGLLGILLGGWGVHRFYLGYIGIGIAQILVTICTCGFGALWGFIEGILIFAGQSITTDAAGRPLQD
jgi:TM2 domain-containing membrane protein YozV